MTDEKRTPSTADHVGQAAGGISGVLAGAAIGTTAGPLGTLLGGIAGAIGGWWSGRAIAEAAEDISEADERYYRDDFARTQRPNERFDAAQHAYYLGDIAGANPSYKDFSGAERDLAAGWNETSRTLADWRSVRDYASVGFARRRERRRAQR